MSKENLVINAEVCDSRQMKEEVYEGYKRIIINAEVLIASPRSREILNRLGAVINSEAIVDVAEDEIVESRISNGKEVISKGSKPQNKVILLANGKVTIEPGTEDVMEQYVYMLINGPLYCPRSMKGYTDKMLINGTTVLYPEDAVILDSKFVMDKFFPLRVKESEKYFIAKKLIIEDAVDADKLVEKNVRFETPCVVMRESKVEKLAGLFDISTKINVIPEDMTFVKGDTELNDALFDKCGSRLYVDGDLTVSTEFARLDKLEKLTVTGTLTVRESMYLEMKQVDIDAGEVEYLFEGKNIVNSAKAKVDRALLMANEKGVRVMNCAMLSIDKDVEPKLICDRLQIKNCAKVSGTEEQESAVHTVSKNVAMIGSNKPGGDGEESGGIMGMMGSVFDVVKQVANTSMINAEKHIM